MTDKYLLWNWQRDSKKMNLPAFHWTPTQHHRNYLSELKHKDGFNLNLSIAAGRRPDTRMTPGWHPDSLSFITAFSRCCLDLFGLRCCIQCWQDNSASRGSRGIYQELICQPFAATIELPCRPAGPGKAQPGLQHFSFLRLSHLIKEVKLWSLLDFILIGKTQLTSNPIIGKLGENREKPVGLK